MRPVYFVLGWISFSLGIVGIFLPILPTTIFLIIAAYCFARSSPKVYHWLLSNPQYGTILTNWMEHGIITRRSKRCAVSGIVLSCLITTFFIHQPLVLLGIFCTLLLVISYIWTRPEQQK